MFIARQPIFDRKLEVFGYELLFRMNSDSSKFDGVSSLEATGSVIGGLFESGIESVVENKRAFVNFDEKFIHSDSIELISPSQLVLEMLENIVIDDSLFGRLDELKGKGYKIALDDFVEDYTEYQLTDIADIIKYDLRATPLSSISRDVKIALSQNKILLAEKVETEQEFQEAKSMGFKLFQGYFFSKPRIVEKPVDNVSSKLRYSMVLEQLRMPEPSYQKIAEIIERDVTLSYRLLKAIKARSGESLVHSIKRALTYMGFKEIERWINIIMIQSFGKSKPKELISLSIIRSKFMERLAENSELLHGKKYESFMVGLFSTMDAILDQPMDEALSSIAISPDTYDALVRKSGELHPLYELCMAYETGSWLRVSELSESLRIDDQIIFESYFSSLEYEKDVCKDING